MKLLAEHNFLVVVAQKVFESSFFEYRVSASFSQKTDIYDRDGIILLCRYVWGARGSKPISSPYNVSFLYLNR